MNDPAAAPPDTFINGLAGGDSIATLIKEEPRSEKLERPLLETLLSRDLSILQRSSSSLEICRFSAEAAATQLLSTEEARRRALHQDSLPRGLRVDGQKSRSKKGAQVTKKVVLRNILFMYNFQGLGMNSAITVVLNATMGTRHVSATAIGITRAMTCQFCIQTVLIKRSHGTSSTAYRQTPWRDTWSGRGLSYNLYMGSCLVVSTSATTHARTCRCLIALICE